MAKRFQLRRGTNAESLAFTGALGEVIMDTTNKILVVHDGTTAGGLSVAARGNANNTVTILNRAGTVLATIPATGLLNNTLTSTATDQALTALQGKVLQDGKLDASANAVSATKLVTARSINGVNFDGTANITVPVDTTHLNANGLDLNNYTTAGFYYASVSARAATFLNCPTTSAFGMLVIKSAGCIQELTEYNNTGTPRTYKRHMYAGAWGTWYEVLTTLNSDTTKLPLTGGTLTGGLTGTTANFTGKVTLGNGLDSTVPISFLNGGTAQKINTGGVLISNFYSDANLVPVNGLYSKGNLQTGADILAPAGLISAGGTVQSGQVVMGAQGLTVNSTSQTDGYGLSLYGSSAGTTTTLPSYGLSFSGTATYGTHGAVTGAWAVYNTCLTSADVRGWIFRNTNSGTTSNVASISTTGVVTATSFVGSLTGNASTATKWQTARTLTLTGDVTGSVSFDGSGNASLTTSIAADSLGVGQSYQNLTASRVIGTTYTNTTGNAIYVSVALGLTAGATASGTVSGLLACRGFAQQSSSQAWVGFVVPNGATYSVGGSSITSWVELR